MTVRDKATSFATDATSEFGRRAGGALNAFSRLTKSFSSGSQVE